MTEYLRKEADPGSEHSRIADPNSMERVTDEQITEERVVNLPVENVPEARTWAPAAAELVPRASRLHPARRMSAARPLQQRARRKRNASRSSHPPNRATCAPAGTAFKSASLTNRAKPCRKPTRSSPRRSTPRRYLQRRTSKARAAMGSQRRHLHRRFSPGAAPLPLVLRPSVGDLESPNCQHRAARASKPAASPENYCANPTRCNNSLNRGSPRKGSKPGSTFKLVKALDRCA